MSFGGTDDFNLIETSCRYRGVVASTSGTHIGEIFAEQNNCGEHPSSTQRSLAGKSDSYTVRCAEHDRQARMPCARAHAQFLPRLGLSGSPSSMNGAQ
jgi:hypothetical protein